MGTVSLNLAYEIARTGLSVSSTATSVVSRNITNADNADGSRRSANLVGLVGGGVRIDGISVAVDTAMFDSMLETNASYGQSRVAADYFDRLDAIVGDPELGLSPSALLSDLQSALQTAAAAPHDASMARAAVSTATTLAGGLNRAAALVEQVRADSDAGLREGVAKLQALLGEFERANNAVVSGEVTGRDTSDSIDARNGLLREISGLIDVRATVRSNNDVVLFAANGATLFETVPRRITIDPAAALSPGQAGGTLRIDGVPAIAAASGGLGGRLGGYLQIRDVASVTFGRQLDEIARGLIVTFAERDQSAVPTLPDRAGLFTYAGGPTLPAAGAVVDGLASAIVVAANVDPGQGGDLARLRDGGISLPGNPAYVYNVAGDAGYGDRLRMLAVGFAARQVFDPSAGLGGEASLAGFAANSAGWLANERQISSDQVQDKQVLNERATGAWQSRVGVNIDDELTTLIALERSYQASSRLITSVNAMFDALLSATG